MTIREQTGRELALKELEDYRAGKFEASEKIYFGDACPFREDFEEIDAYLASPDEKTE